MQQLATNGHTELYQEYLSKNQDLSNYLTEDIQNMIIENRYLISALTDFIPKNEGEYIWGRKAIKRYKEIQKELRLSIPVEILESIKSHQYPRNYYKNSKLSLKNQKRLDNYLDLIKVLRKYRDNNTLKDENAQTCYKMYRNLQDKLRKEIPEKDLPVFEKLEQIQIKPKKVKVLAPASCEICGFPVVTMLTKHHIIPVSKGGKDTVRVCPTCHYMIHKSVERGGVEQAVKDYYAPFEGVIDKMEMYVRIALEA